MEAYIIQAGTPRDRASIPLGTKKGRFIRNEQRREWAPDMLRAAVREWAGLRPDAEPRSASATYNCVGLVFASRRTWVDLDDISMILDDDGYRRVESEQRLRPGDIVIYKDGAGETQHIGIVLDIRPAVETATRNIRILSQWGAMGEYMHPQDHVPPAYGRPSEYRSERWLP